MGNQCCLVKAETFSKCKSGKKLPFLCALQLSQQNDSFLPAIVSNLFFNRKTKMLLQERWVNAVLVFPVKLSWVCDCIVCLQFIKLLVGMSHFGKIQEAFTSEKNLKFQVDCLVTKGGKRPIFIGCFKLAFASVSKVAFPCLLHKS